MTHSSAGDLTLDEEAVQYSYDALGRVTEGFSVSGCSPSARNVLGRDALGHRVSRSVYPCNSGTVSKTEYFVYGADGSLYFREGYNGAGGLIEREAYAFLEDEPVAILRSFDAPTGNFFLHNDHLGRPLAMSGTDGFLKWKGEFEPFGKSLAPRVKTSGIEPGFRFPGQWEYGDSGDVQGGAAGILGRLNAMEDNWHRSYAQRWGRYTQSDSLVSADDSYAPGYAWPTFSQLYAYVSDAPLSSVDPLGLSAGAGTFPNPGLDWPVFDIDKSCAPRKRQAIADAIRHVNAEGPRCLPTSIIAGLRLRHYTIVCGGNQPGICGHEGHTPAEIVLFDDAFNPHSTCGCVQGIIAHELVHKGGASEQTSQACAKSCFRCAKTPEKDKACVCAFP